MPNIGPKSDLDSGAPASLPDSWREKDEGRAAKTDEGAENLPAIGISALHEPQPEQRGGDVDASVGGVGAAGRIAVDACEQEGEENERGDPRRQVDRRAPQAQP
jgi:hypothetical protein